MTPYNPHSKIFGYIIQSDIGTKDGSHMANNVVLVCEKVSEDDSQRKLNEQRFEAKTWGFHPSTSVDLVLNVDFCKKL